MKSKARKQCGDSIDWASFEFLSIFVFEQSPSDSESHHPQGYCANFNNLLSKIYLEFQVLTFHLSVLCKEKIDELQFMSNAIYVQCFTGQEFGC